MENILIIIDTETTETTETTKNTKKTSTGSPEPTSETSQTIKSLPIKKRKQTSEQIFTNLTQYPNPKEAIRYPKTSAGENSYNSQTQIHDIINANLLLAFCYILDYMDRTYCSNLLYSKYKLL
jgi:hypothetical protein